MGVDFEKTVLRVHKNQHDSKLGQFVFHVCYNISYYMDPDTAQLKWYKFVPRLI